MNYEIRGGQIFPYLRISSDDHTAPKKLGIVTVHFVIGFESLTESTQLAQSKLYNGKGDHVCAHEKVIKMQIVAYLDFFSLIVIMLH